MELSDKTKKILIYGGGAASIVALALYMRNRNAARAATGFTGGVSGGGTAARGGPSGGGDSATSAAQINAATQLALAGQAKELTLAQIQAQRDIASLQANAALGVAKTQASASTARAALGALGTPGGAAVAGQATKGVFDILKDLFARVFGPTIGGFTPETSAQAARGIELERGYMAPGSSFINPYVYSPTGNILDADNPAAQLDYYQGSIGSGSTEWFGIGANDYGVGGLGDYTYNPPSEGPLPGLGGEGYSQPYYGPTGLSDGEGTYE